MRRGSFTLGSEELKKMNDDLRREMEEIRSSSKGELLKAWAEMEELEDQKDDLLAENLALRDELDSARRREDELIKQLQSSQEGSQSSNKNKNNRHPFTFRSPSTRSLESQDSTDTQRSRRKRVISEREKIEKEFMSQVQDLEQEKEELVNEWQYKLQCRELVLDSLEKTTIIQGESMEKLRQQLEEQNDDAQNREETLQKRMAELNRKVEEKRKIIAKQDKKMRKYRDYIEELTSELQNLAGDKGRLASSKSTSITSVRLPVQSKETSISIEDENRPKMSIDRRINVPASA